MKIKKRIPSAIHFRFRYLIALICAVTFVIILFFFLKPFNNLAKIYNNRQLEYLIVELTIWQVLASGEKNHSGSIENNQF